MSIDITIQETVNDVDITVNQNVITVNVIRTTGGGGGGVESVTGDLVNNTDPLNPVVETPSLTQVLTAGDILPYTISIPNNTFVTFDLGRELTENYFTTDDVGTGGVFLDKDVVFPDNATIRFQAGYVEDNVTPTNVTLLPYRFTTDAYVFYQGARVTDITLRPEDVCMLKLDGENSTDSIQIWFLTVVSKSSGGSGTVTSVTGDLVDNTDPLNPIVNTPSLDDCAVASGNQMTESVTISAGTDAVGLFPTSLNVSDIATGEGIDITKNGILVQTAGSAGGNASIKSDNITAGNTYSAQLPNKAGGSDEIIAMLSDIPTIPTAAIDRGTFSGEFALSNAVRGGEYTPLTQTGALTLSIGASAVNGGIDTVLLTANGSAISGFSTWKKLSSDSISTTAATVMFIMVRQYQGVIYYTVNIIT